MTKNEKEIVRRRLEDIEKEIANFMEVAKLYKVNQHVVNYIIGANNCIPHAKAVLKSLPTRKSTTLKSNKK